MQCYGLYIKLLKFHSLGVLHRDIRPENILIWDDRAYFIDFGYSQFIGVESKLAGSVTTASQRILLAFAASQEKYEYRDVDDIESFFKMALLYSIPFALP